MSTDRNYPLALVLLDGTVLATSTREIADALAKRGLHVVNASEKAVLDACQALDIGVTPYSDGSSVTQWSDALPVVRAELSRRSANGR